MKAPIPTPIRTYYDDELKCEVKVYPPSGESAPTPKFNNGSDNKMQESRYNKRRKLNKEQFLERCKKKHGERYDYSQTEFSTMNTMVKVICREHGPFTVIAATHTRGGHCPTCGY